MGPSVITRILTLTSLLSIPTFGSLFAQQYEREREESHQYIFEPLRAPSSSPFRTASGKPAPDYWQNRADYELEVELNEAEHEVRGQVTVDYTNNSPQDLEFLWFQLEQNKFAPGSRGRAVTPLEGERFMGDTTGGHKIQNVRVKDGLKQYEVEPLINDTRMKVELQEALQPGDEISINIDFSFEVPEYGADRMGRLKVENGWIYELAQWYPKVCVFDDIKGWNVEPYLGTGEFYLEYGDFDLKVTVPRDHIVAASGKLQNPKEVLTSEQLDRLEKAQSSDETVAIVGKDEIGNSDKIRPEAEGNMLTWHYRIEDSRDMAWASSPAFIWDAAKADLPSGKDITAMSFYPKESAGDSAWGRSTEYTRASIEHYSEKWYEYPYPTAKNVAGIVGGMEYPGLSFCHWRMTERSLWGVTDHEFGHNWFPMIVGSNERLYAWMDEGLNTFINHYSTKAFNDGEYPSRFDNMDRIIDNLRDPDNQSSHIYPDLVEGENLGHAAYSKPALGLLILREYILGPERFDQAFKAYIQRWAYKHPTPRDFFNTMENVGGEELDWFWRGWFYSTKTLDQAITGVSYVNGDPSNGAEISVANRDGLVMPLTVEVVESDGDTGRKRMPVEVWQRHEEWTFRYDSDSPIQKVSLDPDGILPDVNPGNDVWDH